jgi:hypothetical protein
LRKEKKERKKKDLKVYTNGLKETPTAAGLKKVVAGSTAILVEKIRKLVEESANLAEEKKEKKDPSILHADLLHHNVESGVNGQKIKTWEKGVS